MSSLATHSDSGSSSDSVFSVHPKLLPLAAGLGWVLSALLPSTATAQGFAAYISPPRFEVQVKAGESLRQVVEIQHVSQQKGNYRIYTNDWSLTPDNGVAFTNDLLPNSCRPWVAIERRDITVEPGARYRYRFEITPPPGTPDRECRFALMVEGQDPAQVKGNISFPVGGRIAVIVYARIGGAAPLLSIATSQVAKVNGQDTATVDVRNAGNATGRIEGFLNATDAKGKSFEVAPADFPVLPGETRRIAIVPVVEEGQEPIAFTFPLKIKGNFEWGDQRLPIDTSFAP